MIEHVYTIICTKTATDSETNQLTLIDVIEEIGVQVTEEPPPPEQLIIVPLEAVIVSYWVKTSEDGVNRGRVKLSIRAASGKEFHGEGEFVVDLSQAAGTRASGKIGGVPFSGEGLYLLRVMLQRDGEADWSEVGKYPFRVKRQPV
jgi:hypothetical protein